MASDGKSQEFGGLAKRLPLKLLYHYKEHCLESHIWRHATMPALSLVLNP
jgi:hypothetical protein